LTVISSLATELEALARDATNEVDRAIYRAQWACAVARLGRIDDARREIDRLRGANAYKSAQLTAWVLIAEGLADHFESLSSAALDRLRRAYGLAAASGDADSRSFAGAWIAASEFLIGNYEPAVRGAVEAIGCAPTNGHVALSRAHLVVANCLSVAGEHAGAAVHYANARQFAILAHDISMQSVLFYNAAAFRISRLSLEDAFGEPVEAEMLQAKLELESVNNLDRGLRVESLTAMVPLLRAQLLMVERRWADAEALYSAAIPEATSHGQARWVSRFLAEQSHCQAMLGMLDAAASLAGDAISCLSDRTDLDDLAACHARLSQSYAMSGHKSAADDHLRTAHAYLSRYKAFQRELAMRFGDVLSSARLRS
jgi:tetratricopeptide (TPR) repeat protein